MLVQLSVGSLSDGILFAKYDITSKVKNNHNTGKK